MLLFIFSLMTFVYGNAVRYIEMAACAVAVLLLAKWYSALMQRFRDADPFSPYVIFPVAYVFWFLAGTINFINPPTEFISGYNPFDPMPPWMYAVWLLGLAGYILGLLIGRAIPVGAKRDPDHRVDPVKMRHIVRILAAITVLSWIATQIQFNFPMLHPGEAGEARLKVHGIVYQTFITASWTCFVFSPVQVWIRGGKKRLDWVWTIAVPLITGVLLLSQGARSSVATPLLALIIARCYFKKRPGWKLVLGAVVVVLLFSELGYYREDSSWNQQLLEGAGVPGPLVPLLYVGLYVRYTVDTLRSLILTIPRQVPFQHGAITLLPFRTLLPGHQEMSDIYFKNILNRDFTGSGLPGTLLAPLYTDFGFFGIFVGMSGYGALLAWSFRRIRSKLNAIAIISYAWWMQATIFALYSNGFAYLNDFIMPALWVGLLYMVRDQKVWTGRTAVSTSPTTIAAESRS